MLHRLRASAPQSILHPPQLLEAQTILQEVLWSASRYGKHPPFSGRFTSSHRRSSFEPRHSVTQTTSCSTRDSFLTLRIGNTVTDGMLPLAGLPSSTGIGSHNTHSPPSGLGGGVDSCYQRGLHPSSLQRMPCTAPSTDKQRNQALWVDRQSHRVP